MPRPIKIQHPTPQPRSVAQVPIPVGLYCNQKLQTAKIGDKVTFQCEWRKDKRVITNICRFRINSPEFTFMLRCIYGERMTIAKLFEQWEAECINEGLGASAFDREQCLILQVEEVKVEE